jgi:hypothetical protein
MNSFQFKEGSSELLASCGTLWELFISNQAESAGEMSVGVEEYIRSLRDDGLYKRLKMENFKCNWYLWMMMMNRLVFALLH